MELKAGNRVEYIDALRGMTMILVVYSHVALWCFDNLNMAYNDVFMKFRMPTFFFISGWVFFKVDRIWNKETIQSILKKKFMVQIIPFIFFMLLYMYLFNGPEYKTSFENKYGFWFTYILFQYFAIYIGVEALLNRNKSNKIELGIMLFMLSLSVLAFYYEQVRYTENMGIWRPILTVLSFSKLKYIIFFWLGTFVKKNFSTFIRLTDNQYVIALCLAVFLALLIHPFTITNNLLVFISFLLSGVTGIVLLFTFFRKNETQFLRNKRIGFALQYIGQRTLDIYLLHFFVLPYHMHTIGTWLSQYSNKSLDMLIVLALSLWIVTISLVISNIIRLSQFLGHYLFGVK